MNGTAAPNCIFSQVTQVSRIFLAYQTWITSTFSAKKQLPTQNSEVILAYILSFISLGGHARLLCNTSRFYARYSSDKVALISSVKACSLCLVRLRKMTRVLSGWGMLAVLGDLLLRNWRQNKRDDLYKRQKALLQWQIRSLLHSKLPKAQKWQRGKPQCALYWSYRPENILQSISGHVMNLAFIYLN